MNTLLWIALLLIFLWVMGGLVFEVTGFLVHLLLVIGVILLISSLIRGRGRPTV